jgi:two-component system, response regulator, stage 0 sporulation protein F
LPAVTRGIPLGTWLAQPLGLLDPTAKRPCVLVADDDDDTRAMLAAVLRRDGYDVTEARDGHELLELLAPSPLRHRTSPPPDIIVTDVRMPGVDGMSVLAGLRKTGWATPVILITAFANDGLRARATELRADALFTKPFDVDDVRTAVLNLLGAGGWRATAPTFPDIW